MSAANTQGVGQGSAEPYSKGSDRTSMSGDKLVGLRLVDTGKVTFATGTPSTATVRFGTSLSDATGYFAVATPVGATAAIAAAGVAVSTVATTGFTLTSANSVSHSVNWLLLKI